MIYYQVTVLDDCEFITILKVGESKEQVIKAIWDDYANNFESPFSCLMGVYAEEVKEVDGYKIKLYK